MFVLCLLEMQSVCNRVTHLAQVRDDNLFVLYCYGVRHYYTKYWMV
jgi:hypothetical protein